MSSNSEIIVAHKPTRREFFVIRFLIILGLLALIQFLWWFFKPGHVGYPPLYWLLTFSLIFKILRMLHEWYHYFAIHVPKRPTTDYHYTVDILTTACPGEPQQMIIDTLEAIQAITYPHTAYLCDEGDDPVLKEACRRLGVVHVTRTEKVNAKAGNINNALRQATGNICVILDPDHIPIPQFLDRVLPYFEDEKIGYVQVVQAYYNKHESIVAYGAAEQTYHFYGPMMMSMDSYGTAQAIGANCTFRRAALDSIGGHSPGLAEDMHTAMRLHAKGWKSRYVPEVLSKGLVPATLAAYYKQQVKWSRGTFDLFFKVYPYIFSKLTWRQRIHYFALPLYYLFGLVGLIDLIIPVASLLLSEYPWNISLGTFLLRFTPVFGMSMLIRQYSQRWLLENHEKGFHMVGGLLRAGAWWVHLLGFVYTLLGIKVPYIPTPKNDKPQNNFLLCLPNIVGIVISLGAIVYTWYYYGYHMEVWRMGIRRNEIPPYYSYALVMSFFVLINVFVLTFNVIIGQEKFLASFVRVFKGVSRKPILNPTLKYIRYYIWKTEQGVYWLLRQKAALLSLVLVITITGLFLLNSQIFSKNIRRSNTMATLMPDSSVVTGIYVPEMNDGVSLTRIASLEKNIGTPFAIISFYQAWSPQSISSFPTKRIQAIIDQGAKPMITWEPWTNTFPEFKNHPELGQNRKVFRAISQGQFDSYLKQYAALIKAQPTRIFLRFAHEMDNPQYPWSRTGDNTPEEFIKAWQYIVRLFEREGVDNVDWVWNPWSDVAIGSYYPGSEYVDWVGITCLNYGQASADGEWHSFQALYEPYHSGIFRYPDVTIRNKPVMLTEFASTHFGGNQAQWLENALQRVENYPEIRSIIFFNSEKDANWATPWRPDANTHFINWSIDTSQYALEALRQQLHTKPFTSKKSSL